jgi:hypothetical protein
MALTALLLCDQTSHHMDAQAAINRCRDSGSDEALGFDTPADADAGLAPSRRDGPAVRQTRNSRRRRPSTASAASARKPALARQQGGRASSLVCALSRAEGPAPCNARISGAGIGFMTSWTPRAAAETPYPRIPRFSASSPRCASCNESATAAGGLSVRYSMAGASRDRAVGCLYSVRSPGNLFGRPIWESVSPAAPRDTVRAGMPRPGLGL